LVSTVREDDLGHRAPSRLRHVAAIRRAVSKYNHRTLVAGFRRGRHSRLPARPARGRHDRLHCGAETKFEVGLWHDGARDARYLCAELCAWSNPGSDLFSWALLAAAVSLERLSESKPSSAGTDSVCALHGLHRETHARGDARSAAVRLHPHGAREGIERA